MTLRTCFTALIILFLLLMCVWMLMSDGKVATQLAKDSDIHVITGLLKLYFRELPESLFTDALYPNLVVGMGIVNCVSLFFLQLKL